MVSSARSAAVRQVKVVIGRISMVWSRAGIEPARPVGTRKKAPEGAGGDQSSQGPRSRSRRSAVVTSLS